MGPDHARLLGVRRVVVHGQLCLVDDHEDREWVVPSGALNYQFLVDVLDRKGMFPTKTYVAMPGRRRRGATICEANANARAPSADVSYVDARKAAFKKRAHWGQA